MDNSLEGFLKTYDASRYDRPSVTVDTVVFTIVNKEEANYRKLPEKVLRLLMIKRKNHPELGKWALPGGFVNIDESLDDAAHRELKEETNIDNIYMEQLYTYGDVNRDPRTRVISCTYMSLADSTKFDVKAGDDAKDAKWFDVSLKIIDEKQKTYEDGYTIDKIYKVVLVSEVEKIEAKIKLIIIAKGNKISVKREILESNDIAFDHGLIIQYGIERLRSKLWYTDIVFNLMPDKFTLTELQKVYEVILDRNLLKANFRRKIRDLVIETNEFTSTVGHRPSRLYQFNPNWVNM